MLIEVGYDLAYELSETCHFCLMLYVHPDAVGMLTTPDTITTNPSLPIRVFTDSFGNRCARLTAPPGTLRLTSRSKLDVPEVPEITNPDAVQHPVNELPDYALSYLLGSRYCGIEDLSGFAWEQFSGGPTGWQMVSAISQWVHDNIRYDGNATRPNKTALDTWTERSGVCRDLAHLAITLCRCMNIPARYATGYLGAFGAPADDPMDFAAYFEAYVGGRWYPFDPRNNQARIGRVLMARGRDATDTAVATVFGVAELTYFEVFSDRALL